MKCCKIIILAQACLWRFCQLWCAADDIVGDRNTSSVHLSPNSWRPRFPCLTCTSRYGWCHCNLLWKYCKSSFHSCIIKGKNCPITQKCSANLWAETKKNLFNRQSNLDYPSLSNFDVPKFFIFSTIKFKYAGLRRKSVFIPYNEFLTVIFLGEMQTWFYRKTFGTNVIFDKNYTYLYELLLEKISPLL